MVQILVYHLCCLFVLPWCEGVKRCITGVVYLPETPVIGGEDEAIAELALVVSEGTPVVADN